MGHKASDCPEGETVHVNAVSTKKKKKDITKNFAMSIEPVNFDELAFEETEALAETTEGVDSVMCNAMQIVEETGEARKPRIKFLSDLLAIGATSILLEGVPYPRDLVDYNYPDRFVVYQFSEEKYTVLDTYAEQQFQIEAAVLRNPKLDIQNWFRKRCEEADDEFRITCWDSSEPDLNDSFYASVTEPEPSHNFELLDEAISQVPPSNGLWEVDWPWCRSGIKGECPIPGRQWRNCAGSFLCVPNLTTRTCYNGLRAHNGHGRPYGVSA